jgi:hypothetical protein
MDALVLAIHVLKGIYVLTGIHVLKASGIKDMDGRNKSGHDESVSHECPAVRSLIEADTGIRDRSRAYWPHGEFQ